MAAVGLLVVVAFAYSLVFDSIGLAGLLASTWMPHVYVWPYLLLLVSSASVAVGYGEDLWAFVLAGGLLVHGHVSFALPVVAFTVAVTLAWALRPRDHPIRALSVSSRIAAALVLALFLLPLVLQLITEFPGQFGGYVSYLRQTDLPPRGLGTVARFMAQYWGFGAASVWAIPSSPGRL